MGGVRRWIGSSRLYLWVLIRLSLVKLFRKASFGIGVEDIIAVLMQK